MNIKELKKLLGQYPDDMEILYSYCSDFALLEADEIKTIQAVPQRGYWMRPHRTMSEDNKARMRTYLMLPGN